ncbi:hypothetical protein G6F65_021304 [Rhizopus arrhizus]|nr:hypothetical protein G6F65_021304 [Rhizopus arrhizus]
MRDVVGPGQVHVDHAAEFVLFQIPDAGGGDDARIVDQDIHAPQHLRRMGQGRFAGRGLRHVAMQVHAALRQRGAGAFGIGLVQHGHGRALRKKKFDDGRADATGVGAPRDHGALAGQKPKRAGHHDFTNAQPPSFSGRKACSAGILRTRL